MIPLSDQTPQRRRTTPVVMVILVALNILVYFYEVSLGDAQQQFILSYGAVPYSITTGHSIGPSQSPPLLTLITSMFLHGSLLHIAGNMLYLWVFGDNVEDALGHYNFALFYFVTGIVAGVSQVLIDPQSQVPGIGASGAIAGVLAAYLLLFPHSSVRTLLLIGPFIAIRRLSAVILIGFWILLQIASGLLSLNGSAAESGGVAYWAHIGGFVAGLIITWLYQQSRRGRSDDYLNG